MEKIRYGDALEWGNVTGWICKACGKHHGEDEPAKRRASKCCANTSKCQGCGGDTEGFNADLCLECAMAQGDREREKDLYQAAIDHDYEGPVFCIKANNYFKSVEECKRYFSTANENPPKYVFACRLVEPEIKSRSVIERIEISMEIEFGKTWDGIEELQKHLDEFCELNKENAVWVVDRTTRVSTA